MKIFKGDFYRISVLTDKLIRLEYSKNGQFEDRHTQLIQNRDFGEVEVEATETPELLDINTKFFRLRYNKGEFNNQNLFIELKGQFALYGSRWYFGEPIETLKGTPEEVAKDKNSHTGRYLKRALEAAASHKKK